MVQSFDGNMLRLDRVDFFSDQNIKKLSMNLIWTKFSLLAVHIELNIGLVVLI